MKFDIDPVPSVFAETSSIWGLAKPYPRKKPLYEPPERPEPERDTDQESALDPFSSWDHVLGSRMMSQSSLHDGFSVSVPPFSHYIPTMYPVHCYGVTHGSYYRLGVRTIDGEGNNTDSPDFGAAGSQLRRLVEATDTGDILSGANRLSAREVSNIVMQQTEDTPNSAGASDFLWMWGQFLDHDIGLTEAGNTEAADIEVPLGDPFFDPFGTGTATIQFNRVDDADPDTLGRQYDNDLTAFIDGSQIYGSSQEVADGLRVDGGRLLISDGGLLLPDPDGGDELLTGDIRAAENIALTSLHTLFVREHNRIADEISEQQPWLSDDAIFNLTRAQVEAVMQAITFNEFLPLLVGEDAFDAYAGYDSTVDPGLSVEFSTAVFRFGHTLLSPELLRTEEDGSVIAAGNIALRDAFFAPDEIADNGGIDPILRGGAEGVAQELDALIVEDVRSFLFGPPGAGGFDLASLNIQRGRDLGLPDYNTLREALGLERVTSFDQISSDANVAASLEAAYGSVDDIDAWIGGLAEDAFGDGMLGETFSVAIIDQFSRLRDGDAFWSEGRGFRQRELDELWSTSLSDVIERNTDVDHIQRDVFLAHDRIGGTDNAEHLEGDDGDDLIIGFGGADMLYGNGGDDDLFGDDGEDILVGGAGNDIMTGGADADTFVFDATVAGRDIITDFTSEDTLDVSNFSFRDFSVQHTDGGLVVNLSDDASIVFENTTSIGTIFDDLFNW